jgi:hypothetical protein
LGTTFEPPRAVALSTESSTDATYMVQM